MSGLDKFFSTKMEENTCLLDHLDIMNKIHEHLTGDLDYWMTDELAIDGVLHSLPPATKICHKLYHARESFTFHEFLVRARRKAKREFIDGEGIY